MKILLHICCSNCAIYPFKLLHEEGHKFTGFWFNPNIQPHQEYELRLDSLKILADRWYIDMFYLNEYKPVDYFKTLVDANLIHSDSLSDLDNFSHTCKIIPPSPERCKACYKLRLEKTAEEAKSQGFDAFSTTLLISPYQNFEQIVSTGKELEDKYNVFFYLRDFRPHFRASMAFAKREFGLYRQKYCGCIFSREERLKKVKLKNQN